MAHYFGITVRRWLAYLRGKEIILYLVRITFAVSSNLTASASMVLLVREKVDYVLTNGGISIDW
jgi:hypothetical protein